jgi:hypothetical protein
VGVKNHLTPRPLKDLFGLGRTDQCQRLRNDVIGLNVIAVDVRYFVDKNAKTNKFREN